MNRKIGMITPKMFDEKFYHRAYMDVECFKENLYCHYIKIGVPQNRLPSMEIFRQIYPLFNLKIYKILSRELEFEYEERYYSHFHHCGFDQNKYFGFKNKMFINKGRLCIIDNNTSRCMPFSMYCSQNEPISPNLPCCESIDHSAQNNRKHEHKHECKTDKHNCEHKTDKHEPKHKTDKHEPKHKTDKLHVRYRPKSKSIVNQSTAEFSKTNLLVSPTNTAEINPATNIAISANEAISIIARIKKERDTAIKVIDDSENAIRAIDYDPLIGSCSSTGQMKAVDRVKQKKTDVSQICSLQILDKIEPTYSESKDVIVSQFPNTISIKPVSDISTNHLVKNVTSNQLVWTDLNLLPYARSTNGNFIYREFVKFDYSMDGSIVIKQLALPINEGIEFTAEMPDNWNNNTMIIPHLHWTPSTDMYDMSENINLTWMIKSVGSTFEDSNQNTQNTFNQLIKIGPENKKVHARTNFSSGTPMGLVGHNHIIVGHLRRMTSGSSYTDDIFIIGLDLSLSIDPLNTYT